MKSSLKHLEAYCEKQKIRLTEPRKHVYSIIASEKKPIVAYDVLAKLARKMPNPKPPTAYRAIEFLLEHGFIHRIESLNAYICCEADHKHTGSQFLICDSCGTVSEAHLCHVPAPIAAMAAHENFSLTRWNMELHGLCASCSVKAHKHASHNCACH
ncbi:MAG: transcriptional repressor [Alphaproteobacteria bacterium]|nr:transcriptional repressor [Alphaproteobacteria bacterium]